MTVSKTHWLRNSILILLVCAIAGLALSGVLFFKNAEPTRATATIEFTFEGAADGLAPNGSAFSISDIAGDEVLTEALEQAGLQDTYTVEQLRANLTAQGVYPEDMAGQVMSYESLLNFTANRESTITEYHPTTFDISLSNGFDTSISKQGLQELLKNILQAYKAYFAKVGSNGLEKEDTLFSLQDYDYPQQLQILEGRYTAMTDYAQKMYTNYPSFMHEGAGFNDIAARLSSLISSDIARLNATMTMNALSRDTDRLQAQYTFESLELSHQLEMAQVQLGNMDDLIASYQKNGVIYLSDSQNVTRIDGNSNETYDALVQKRMEIAQSITLLKAQIADTQAKIADLSPEAETAEAEPADDAQDAGDLADVAPVEETGEAADNDELRSAQAASLESSIDALVKKGDAIIDAFAGMLQACNEQQINDLTVSVTGYGYQTPRILSGAFVKQAILVAGPICALGFILCMVLIIRSRRREERQRG